MGPRKSAAAKADAGKIGAVSPSKLPEVDEKQTQAAQTEPEATSSKARWKVRKFPKQSTTLFNCGGRGGKAKQDTIQREDQLGQTDCDMALAPEDEFPDNIQSFPASPEHNDQETDDDQPLMPPKVPEPAGLAAASPSSPTPTPASATLPETDDDAGSGHSGPTTTWPADSPKESMSLDDLLNELSASSEFPLNQGNMHEADQIMSNLAATVRATMPEPEQVKQEPADPERDRMIKEAREDGTFDTRGFIGQKFAREHGKDTEAGKKYRLLASTADLPKFKIHIKQQ